MSSFQVSTSAISTWHDIGEPCFFVDQRNCFVKFLDRLKHVEAKHDPEHTFLNMVGKGACCYPNL